MFCHNVSRQRRPPQYAYFCVFASCFSQCIACDNRDECTDSTALLSSSGQYWCVGWVWACGSTSSHKGGTLSLSIIKLAIERCLKQKYLSTNLLLCLIDFLLMFVVVVVRKFLWYSWHFIELLNLNHPA
jgi:hypothetical protein